MAWISEAIDEVIRVGVSPLLEDRSFRRRRRDWMLQTGEVTRSVNVQANRANTAEYGSFTMNLGLLHHDLFGSPAGFVSYKECVVVERIGMLTEPPEDRWWELAPGVDVEHVADDTVAWLVGFGLPWLERCSDPMEVIEYTFGDFRVPRGWERVAGALGIDVVARASESLDRHLDSDVPTQQLALDLGRIGHLISVLRRGGGSLTQQQLSLVETRLRLEPQSESERFAAWRVRDELSQFDQP